jgi:hypothetical protein
MKRNWCTWRFIFIPLHGISHNWIWYLHLYEYSSSSMCISAFFVRKSPHFFITIRRNCFFYLILDSWILIVFYLCLSSFMSLSLYWRQNLFSHSSSFLINILTCSWVLLKVLMVDSQTPRTKGILNKLLAPISCIQMKIMACSCYTSSIWKQL